MYNLSTMQRLYLTVIFAFLSACSMQQTEQDGGNLTRSEVEVLSQRMAERIEEEFPLLQHKVVNRYVSSLGQSLISRNPSMPPLPYEFRVLRSNEVFAFSLPGGIVYVSLGLIRIANAEGDLASALAHELAHQKLNHPLVSWRRKLNANRSNPAVLEFSGDWRERFLGVDGALVLSPAMEQEADEVAPIILYHARYEPRLYMSYLQTLKALEQSSLADVAALLRAHPRLNDRIQWTKAGLTKLPPLKEAEASSASFQQVKSLLREAAKKNEKPAKGSSP